MQSEILYETESGRILLKDVFNRMVAVDCLNHNISIIYQDDVDQTNEALSNIKSEQRKIDRLISLLATKSKEAKSS